MKRKEVYFFKEGLNRAAFETPRCTYAVNKNKRLVEQEIKDMEDGNISSSDEHEKYLKEQEALNIEHTPKDGKGEPKIITKKDQFGRVEHRYDVSGFDDSESAYEKAISKLKKKYEEEITNHEKKVKNYNEKFLLEDSEFKPFTIPIDAFDGEKCPQRIMDGIWPMIKED